MEPQPLPAALNPKSMLVKPGSPVKLKNFDPSFTGDLKKKAAKDLLQQGVEELGRLGRIRDRRQTIDDKFCHRHRFLAGSKLPG